MLFPPLGTLDAKFLSHRIIRVDPARKRLTPRRGKCRRVAYACVFRFFCVSKYIFIYEIKSPGVLVGEIPDHTDKGCAQMCESLQFISWFPRLPPLFISFYFLSFVERSRKRKIYIIFMYTRVHIQLREDDRLRLATIIFFVCHYTVRVQFARKDREKYIIYKIS